MPSTAVSDLDAHLGAQHVLAQALRDRARPARAAATARNSSRRVRASASRAIDAALRVVQAGERAARQARASRCRPRAGPAGSSRRPAPRNASTPRPSARSTDRRQLSCSSLFLQGFHVVVRGAILAEFAPVPNAPSDVRSRPHPAAPQSTADARARLRSQCRRPRRPPRVGGPAGPRAHALRRLGKQRPLHRLLGAAMNSAPAVAASRRVQVHVHDGAVDPASHHRRRGRRSASSRSSGGSWRSPPGPDAYATRDAAAGVAARQTTAGRLHVLVRLSLLQRHPAPRLGYRPRPRARAGAPQRRRGRRRGAAAHGAGGLAGLPRRWPRRGSP